MCNEEPLIRIIICVNLDLSRWSWPQRGERTTLWGLGCGGHWAQDWVIQRKEAVGDETDTAQDTLTVEDKRKVVPDDPKVSRIGHWNFTGVSRNFIFIPDRSSVPSLTVGPFTAGTPGRKGTQEDLHLSGQIKSENCRTCRSSVLLMSSLRNGWEKRIRWPVPLLEWLRAAALTHLPCPALRARTDLLVRRLPQLPMFTPPLRVHLCVFCLSLL